MKSSNGALKLKDIAEQLGVSDNQIRKWKNQDKWDDQINGTLPKTNSNVTNKTGTPKANGNTKRRDVPKMDRNEGTAEVEVKNLKILSLLDQYAGTKTFFTFKTTKEVQAFIDQLIW